MLGYVDLYMNHIALSAAINITKTTAIVMKFPFAMSKRPIAGFSMAKTPALYLIGSHVYSSFLAGFSFADYIRAGVGRR
jgi:hypothetical protein